MNRKKWLIGGLFVVLLSGGVFAFSGVGLDDIDPFRMISVPPPPEAEFVPSSQESAQGSEPEAVEQTKPVAGDICTGNASTDFDCYEQHYIKLVKEDGIKAAFVDLKARYEHNAFVVSQCHPITHVIGREAALKFKTPGEAYTQGDGYCWSGYYHGVLETFLDKIGRENLPKEINSVCDDIEGKSRYSFDYYNCVHGLGHGVMAITDTELFQSLDYCELLEGEWEQKSCASGVFMENVIVDNLNHFTKYLKPAEPLYPCTAVSGKFKETCYLMQTSYILKVNGGNFTDTFAWCRKAEEGHRATCFQSLGRDASGRTSSEAGESKRICLLGKDFYEQSNCVVGAVKDFISYFHSMEQADDFCALFENIELVATCRDTADSYWKQF